MHSVRGNQKTAMAAAQGGKIDARNPNFKPEDFRQRWEHIWSAGVAPGMVSLRFAWHRDASRLQMLRSVTLTLPAPYVHVYSQHWDAAKASPALLDLLASDRIASVEGKRALVPGCG